MFRALEWSVVASLIGLAACSSGGGGGGGGSGNAACASGCQQLADCGLCLQGSTGACLSVSECASTCSGVATGPAVAQCVSGAGCDQSAIAACVGPASGGGGADCSGCYWDGSACTWCSTSNWGSGPYSGACSSCDSSCCAGH